MSFKVGDKVRCGACQKSGRKFCGLRGVIVDLPHTSRWRYRVDVGGDRVDLREDELELDENGLDVILRVADDQGSPSGG